MAEWSTGGRSKADRSYELTGRPPGGPPSGGRQRSRRLAGQRAGRHITAADARDTAAEARDVAATARDVVADLRDREWIERHPVAGHDVRALTGAEIVLQRAKHLSEAAYDRSVAAQAQAVTAAASARQHAAADRAQAARDRTDSHADRRALMQQLASVDERAADGWGHTFWRIFGLSQQPMMLLDQDRRIVAVNHALAETLGYSRGHMAGLRIDTFYDPDEWEFLETNWRVFQSRGTFNGDGTMLNADGERVQLRFAAHWAQIEGRSIALYVALISGLEPRKRKPLVLQTGDRLTPRELEVIGWVALGRRAHEIAHELGIGSTTVESHTRNAMRKVGARSQAQLVAIVCARELLDPSGTRPTVSDA